MIFGTEITGTYRLSLQAWSSWAYVSGDAYIQLLEVSDAEGNPIPFSYTFETNAVPEPATALPFALALGLFTWAAATRHFGNYATPVRKM